MLDVPALFNMLFGVVISFTTGPFPLMSLFTGLWIVWVCTPAAFVLPFELTGDGLGMSRQSPHRLGCRRQSLLSTLPPKGRPRDASHPRGLIHVTMILARSR